MPILFPFALNVMTGMTYTFLMIMFFVSTFCFLIFNMWKLHRQCVEHKVLRVILESLAYVLSFFLLLNVWPTGTNPMPYVVIKGWKKNKMISLRAYFFLHISYLLALIKSYLNAKLHLYKKMEKKIKNHPTLGKVIPPLQLSIG